MKFFILILTVLLITTSAKAELSVELAQDRVDITTGFNGTEIALFGMMDEEVGGVIVVVKGPESTIAVRRKDKVLGAWMNRQTLEFRRVPSYYDIASTFDNAYFSSNDAFLKDKGIGHNNLGFYPEDENEDVQTVSLFSDALIRNMQEKGFFPIKTGDINMISKNFFKAEFHLPPDVPTGLYTVETFIVREDKVISHQSRKLQVGQVGFNAGVYLYAQQHSLLYGIFTVMVALISGWSAFTFLRRD